MALSLEQLRERHGMSYQRKEEPGFFKELGGDIKQTAIGVKNRISEGYKGAQRAADAFKRGDIGLGSYFWQFGGEVAGTVSGVIGEGVKGVVKLPLSQKREDNLKRNVGNIVNSALDIGNTRSNLGKIGKKYSEFQEARPEAAGNLRAAGQIVELGADLFGLGRGKKIASQGIDAAKDVSKRGIDATTDMARRSGNMIRDRGTKGFDFAKKKIQGPTDPAEIIKLREKELFNIENNYATLRKKQAFSKDANTGSRQRVSQVDIGLDEAIDESGTIRTIRKGGAVDQYKAQTLDGTEQLGRRILEKEGASVTPDIIKQKLKQKILNSGLEGSALRRALKGIDNEVDGLLLRAEPNGKILLEKIHDAKINTTNGINFATEPHVKTQAKAFARAYKELIEDTSKTDIGIVNKELEKYLKDIEYLKSLDGRKVKGGRLGKYFAQISGNMAGAVAGGAVGGYPGAMVGTVVGGELGRGIQSKLLKRTFGGKIGTNAPKSQILERAVKDVDTPTPRLLLSEPKPGSPRTSFGSMKTINLPRRSQSTIDNAQSLGPRYANQSIMLIKAKSPKNVISKSVPQKAKNVKDNLIQEARKYKSAEEFVEAIKLKDKKLERFARNFVREDIPLIRQKIKISDIETSGLKSTETISERAIKDPSFPVVVAKVGDRFNLLDGRNRITILKNRGVSEVDAIVAQPKSQLIDIWNKAQKKSVFGKQET